MSLLWGPDYRDGVDRASEGRDAPAEPVADAGETAPLRMEGENLSAEAFARGWV